MTQGMIGADVEELRRLAGQFDSSASRLSSLASSVSNGVRTSPWVGPFASQFRSTWDSSHSPTLRYAADELHRHAVKLRTEADQQQAASAASRTNSSGGFCPVPGASPGGGGGGGGSFGPSILDRIGSWRDAVEDKLEWPLIFSDVKDTIKEFLKTAAGKKLWDKLDDLDEVAKLDELLKGVPPWLTKGVKIAGRLALPVSAALGGLQILVGIHEGNKYKVADGAISLGLIAATVGVGLVACPPAAVAVGVVAIGWGVAQALSGDTPVSERIVDAGRWVGNQAANLGQAVTRSASNLTSALGQSVQQVVQAPAAIAQSVLSAPLSLFG